MKYISGVLFVVILAGCDFGVDFSNTPQNVYKSVMKLYSQNYAYIHEVAEADSAKTPTRLFDRYWPRVSGLEASEEGWIKLAQVFEDFMGLMADEHIGIEYGYEACEEESVCRVTKRVLPPARSKASLSPTKESLEYKVNIQGDTFAYLYGQIRDNSEIGYILVRELSENISALDRANDDQIWLKKIDPIIEKLKSAGVKKMILDIQSSAGGSQTNAEYIVARFIKKRAPYMVSYDLVGPAEKKSSYVRKVVSNSPNSSGARFSGSVVLLQDASTGSGGEVFALAARKIPGIKTFGVNTGGLPGTITVYDLPNHWTVQLTTSRTYPLEDDGSEGATYLTVGIPPDEKVENDPDTVKDEILEAGIKWLEPK